MPDPSRFGPPPSEDDIADMAEAALASIPAPLARHVRNLGIMVDDAADDETVAELGLDSAWELTGLYQGTPLTERGANDGGQIPDMIHLFREPILLEWIETGQDLRLLVRTVLIHEIAHRFGFSDAEIEALERE